MLYLFKWYKSRVALVDILIALEDLTRHSNLKTHLDLQKTEHDHSPEQLSEEQSQNSELTELGDVSQLESHFLSSHLIP